MGDAIEEFRIEVPDAVLADLERRLEATRLPDPIEGVGWSYGMDVGYLGELLDYWRKGFDWRAQEARMNAFENFRTEIEGVPIHFVRAQGVGPNPIPLILSHGWPWTYWDFHKVIEACRWAMDRLRSRVRVSTAPVPRRSAAPSAISRLRSFSWLPWGPRPP